MKQLKRGMKGSDVAKLIEALRKNGHKDLVQDGIFGPKVEAAVKSFQKTKGLNVDGIAGIQTQRALSLVMPEGRENKNGELVTETPKDIYKPVIPDLTPVKGKHIFPRVTRVDLDPDRGAVMKPNGIVWHYTVSYHTEATVEYFKRNLVDVQFVIGHKGEIIQMVEGNRKAAHAGVSAWRGEKNLNNSYLGIEFINIGPLYPHKGGYLDYYENQKMKAGKKFKYFDGPVADCLQHGHRFWEALTPAQLQAGKEVTYWALKTYGFSVDNVVSHAEVSPGRKIDVGGTIGVPMSKIRSEMKAWLKA